MGVVELNHEFIQQLKFAANSLLLPPSEIPLLLSLLDELAALLAKIGQAPSSLLQESLLPVVKALVSDKLMTHSDEHVVITLAYCLSHILRIYAPVAPYDDHTMKDIFKLIVQSFEKLSSPSGACYSKSVVILESVARLRSCVMMLDLHCDSLIIYMFQLFLKHICSNHPHSVFLAMEKIMSVMIKESDSLSLELLKDLLESIRKENQDVSPESFNLGAKVVEECSEKLKPYITEAVTLMGCCLEDYAPILSSICETKPIDVKDLVQDSAKLQGISEPTADKLRSAQYVQALKAIERCNSNPGKFNSHDEGDLKRSLGTPRSKKAVPTMKDESFKRETEHAGDLDNKKDHQAIPLGGNSDKKGKPQKKDDTGGSRKKSTALSRKDKIRTNNAFQSQRKRAFSDDDVIETPHGRKNYKEDLLGCRIKVWWPLDRRYYEGTVSSFDESTAKHKVEYDDGDEEVLNLRTEKWEFLGDEILNDVDLFVDKRSPQPRPNKPKREVSNVCEKETLHSNPKKREEMPDCEAETSDGIHQAAKIVDKVKIPEDLNEMKRPKLSDGQKS